ncbi:hypothetical protein D9619_012641 [Psilocybe cf. subviscida]|uniref:EF-hand domain-containing protein n=1 Tax=Psilocybe cf. subviscida TaxID=2480587 RepID=A0A8H5B7K2_9AGAR|nr:hypothetical protein D9619_012641 [Psilocybe cf. subviscida]
MFPIPTYDGGVHHHFLQNVTHQKGEKFHWHTISLPQSQFRPPRPSQQQSQSAAIPLKKAFTVSGALSSSKSKLKGALAVPSTNANGKAPPSPTPASDTATLQGSYRSESATIVDVDDVLSSAPDSARAAYQITEEVITHIAAYHQTAPPTSSHSDPGLSAPTAPSTGGGSVSPATAIWQIGELAAQIQSAVVPLLTWNLYAVHETLERCLRNTTELLGVVLANLKKWNDAQRQPQQRSALETLPESTSQPSSKQKTGRRLSLNFHLGKGKPKNTGPSKMAMTLGLGKGATAARDLRENVEYLVKAHKALLDSAQVVIHVRPSASNNFVIPAPSLRGYVDHRGEQKMRSMMADVRGPSVYEAKNFWRRYIGDESEFADSEDFCSLLSDWTDESLPKLEQQRLLLRLDPSRTGYISFSTFKSFVRNGKLRESVHAYCSDPPLPLLLWVDADVTRVVPQILEATALGIKVLQFASATGTKSWLRLNREFLKQNDSAGHVRILVNQVLFERHDDTHMPNVNDGAGQEVCAAVRDAGLSLPVLVYTTPDNIDATRWVKDFPQAGSVGGNHLVYTSYISALAAGKVDDSLWRRYNAP